MTMQNRDAPSLDIRAGDLAEATTRRDAIVSALCHRHDPTSFPLTGRAAEWRGMSLGEIARQFLEDNGLATRGLSRPEVVDLAMRGGYNTTSDFPAILADVANKTLRKAYEAAPQTFRPFCRRVNAADFKAINRLQLGGAPALEKVGEHGEFKRGTIEESRETYKLATFGKIVAITRQVVINDDLDAFTRIPAAYGQSAANLESDTVWAVITANANMADGNALFSAAHNNLKSTGGSAPDVTSVGAARSAMRQQKGLDGKTILNVQPAYLIVPSALETKAAQLATQITPAQTSQAVPEFVRSLQPIAEPRLDDDSASAWYIAASPAQIDTVEYCYLEGQEGAFIETRMGFDVDGVQVKCRLDFAAKAIDWRGLYKNVGV